MKSSEVSIKTRSTPASLTIQGEILNLSNLGLQQRRQQRERENLYNVGEVSCNSIDRDGVQVRKENEKFTVVCSRSPQNLEFGHFALLFCSGRQRALSIQPKLSKIWKQRQMVQKFPGKVSRNSGNC